MSKRRHRTRTRDARRRDAAARRVGRDHETPCQTCGGRPSPIHDWEDLYGPANHPYQPTQTGILVPLARLHESGAA